MEERVLCCCHNVTLNDMKRHIKEGVKTFEELQEKTNISTDCPPCKVENEQLFKEFLDAKE